MYKLEEINLKNRYSQFTNSIDLNDNDKDEQEKLPSQGPDVENPDEISIPPVFLPAPLPEVVFRNNSAEAEITFNPQTNQYQPVIIFHCL